VGYCPVFYIKKKGHLAMPSLDMSFGGDPSRNLLDQYPKRASQGRRVFMKIGKAI
jgi:hypothetical protein